MHRVVLSVVACSVFTAVLRADELSVEEKRALVALHETAFQALAEKIRDPFVTLGPDGYYYVTGTTAGSHWGDTVGIHVWRSSDLAAWEDLGFVWDLKQDGAAAGSWHFDQPIKDKNVKNPLAIWAPEIHFLNGTWWIPHCTNQGGHGLLRGKTGRSEGPYEAMGRLHHRGIDAHLFQDDDGAVYYLWGSNNIARMNDAMTETVEPFVSLEHDGRHPLGYEGVLLKKIGGKYVLIASGRYGYEPTNTYDLYYAVSDTLKGPYGPRRMAIKNAGHGNLFQDKQGRWWSTAFDHEFTDLWSLWLVPIDVRVEGCDIVFDVKDERFRPTEEDQAVVRRLARDGRPKEWDGRSPWWRPEKDDQ